MPVNVSLWKSRVPSAATKTTLCGWVSSLSKYSLNPAAAGAVASVGVKAVFLAVMTSAPEGIGTGVPLTPAQAATSALTVRISARSAPVLAA